jgi:serine/threonine-protein kinase
MPRLDADRWQVLVPHLDRAFELDREERPRWLASLRDGDPLLASEVEALLEKHRSLEARRFLDRGPLFERPAPALAGQVLGSYRLLSPIGRGGMGSVWLAERCDGRFRGEVAVKILNASLVGRDGEARFEREGSILARLRHPHIAHLIDAGVSAQGQPYLVLERVDGERIDSYCDARGLGVPERIRLFLDVLSAVAHAHANLVVHRDLKPSNVLVDAAGRVKLLDFGIAKLLQDDPDALPATVTREGDSPLTPAYAAPEQLTGGDVTTATDVYALGVLLYVLLAGRHPASEDTLSPAELVRAIVDTEATRPSDAAVAGAATLERATRRATTPRRLRGALRGDLDNIVARALKKRPGERYASVEALAEDLRRHLANEPVSARRDSMRYRAGRFLRRHRWPAVAAGLLVLSLAAGFGASAWQAARARKAAARAQAATEFLVGLFELSSGRRPQSETVTARELLDQGVKRLDAELADQPDLRGSLLGVMGRVHASLGLYGPASDLLERSEKLLRQQRPADDPERARVLSELANVRDTQGDYAGAVALARESLAIQRRVHGGDHADIPVTLDRLGVALSNASQDAEAEPILREALAMRRRLYGNAHREVVSSLSHLANVFYDRGDYAAAEATHREALSIALSMSGDSYPEVPWAMTNLASVLSRRGRTAEAVPLLREALVRWRARLGDHHPDLTPAMRALATALRTEGRIEEATGLFEQTLAIERQAYGDAHHEVAKTTHDLAALLHEQGRLGDAEARYRDCLAILERALSADHPHVGRALTSLARVLADQGRHGAAEPLFRRALAILEARLGKAHDLTAAAQAGLARSLVGQGRSLAEAQEMLERATAVYRDTLGPSDSRTAEMTLSLAECLQARGRTAAARTLARDVLPVIARARGDHDLRTQRARRLAGPSAS